MKFTTIVVLAIVSQAQPVNPTAATLAGFTERVKAYEDLRNGVEKGNAELKSTKNSAELVARRDALAAKVRAARAGAKMGDIFTADTRPVFLRLLSPALKGPDGKENKAAIKDDSPGPMTLKINAPYPTTQPLSTVPPDILKALPPLPADIEYRFVGRHLILYDASANLVIDVLPNAIP
jgi:hypothetical protein